MTGTKAFKVSLLVAVSLTLAVIVAIFLASPVMAALGMTSIGA